MGGGLERVIETDTRASPRVPESWVRIYAGVPVPGTREECIVRENRTGKHYVGRLLSFSHDPFVEVELLGATDQTVWFERGEATISSLPPHQWRERRAVAVRQRRGEPAAEHPVYVAHTRVVRATDPLPRGPIHRFAAALGVPPSFVAKAYRGFVTEHDAEPTEDQLLDACAALELETERKTE